MSSNGDQGSTTQDAAQGAAPSTSTNAAPSAPVSVDLSSVNEKLAALEKDNKKLRDKLRELKSTTTTIDTGKGVDHEAAISALRKQIEDMTPLVERAKKIDEAKAARISKMAESLDDEDRALIGTVSDLDARERLVEKLTGAKAVKPTPAPNVSTTSGAEPTVADVMSGKVSVKEAREKHPGLWAQIVGTGKKGSSVLSQYGIR